MSFTVPVRSAGCLATGTTLNVVANSAESLGRRDQVTAANTVEDELYGKCRQ